MKAGGIPSAHPSCGVRKARGESCGAALLGAQEAGELLRAASPSVMKQEELIDHQAGPRNYRCQCANYSIRGWHLTSSLSSEENVCTWEPRAVAGRGAPAGLDGLTTTDLIASPAIGAAMAPAQPPAGRPLAAEPTFQYAPTPPRSILLGRRPI